jgi:Family of unknown function (DUF5302)
MTGADPDAATIAPRHDSAFGGDADHYQPPRQAACRYHMCEAVDMSAREEVCMIDAAPEPEGSEEEIKRNFREALERKRAKHADATAARAGKDAGKVHGARGLARGRRSFRRKTGG